MLYIYVVTHLLSLSSSRCAYLARGAGESKVIIVMIVIIIIVIIVIIVMITI